MLHCLPDTILIIDPDVANAWDVRPDIDKHQWYLAEPKMLDQRILHAKCKDGYSIHSTLDHAAHRRLHAFGIMYGGG